MTDDIFTQTNTDTEAAPTENYRPLPTAEDLAERPKEKEYSGEADGLREAAKDLTAARAAAEAEPIDRSYRHDAGRGEPLESHFTLDAKRAAEDLTRVREADAASQQPPADAVAAAVDAFRAEYNQQPQQQQQPDQTQQPQAPTSEAQQAQQQQQPQDPATEVREALEKNPALRRALEQEMYSVEQSRSQYVQAARQAATVAAAACLADHPALANLSAQEFPHAMSALAKTDPAQAAAIQAKLNRVQSLYNASVEAQQQQQQIQTQNLKQWVAAEDAKFTQAMANETPETMRKLAENTIALAEEYGVSREQLGAVWHSQPVLRSAAFQRIMVDAAKYRMAQKTAPTKLAKPVPTVQRPGVAGQQSRDSDVDAAMKTFRDDPSPKNAAKLLMARRTANN